MSRLLNARILAKNGEFCNSPFVLNCDKIIGHPKLGWLTRKAPGCCGGNGDVEYLVTTDQSKTDANSVAGVLVQVEGVGDILLDTATVAGMVDSCNKCCSAVSADNVLANVLAGVIPAFGAAAEAVYCITRSDDGSNSAVQKMQMDYYDKVLTFAHKSNAAGVSKYRVTATGGAPKAIGTDVVAAGECP